MPTKQSKALIVGLSGVSSSGKTTLARLLCDIYPHTFILHEDDFYKSNADIPTHPTAKVADWDCLEALDLPALDAALQYIRAHGSMPPDFSSKEDQNSVGDGAKIDQDLVRDLKRRAEQWESVATPPIAIIDGFLLYSQAMQEIREKFDVKLLLTTDFATVKARREARPGYATLGDFWEDPAGYVDDVVWPNYVRDHAFLFPNGDVESAPDEKVLAELGINAQPPGGQSDMNSHLKWATAIIDKALTKFAS